MAKLKSSLLSQEYARMLTIAVNFEVNLQKRDRGSCFSDASLCYINGLQLTKYFMH